MAASGVLTWRKIQRLLMQQGVLRGKIDGQPTTMLLNLYNQEKSRLDVQEAGGSYSSKNFSKTDRSLHGTYEWAVRPECRSLQSGSVLANALLHCFNGSMSGTLSCRDSSVFWEHWAPCAGWQAGPGTCDYLSQGSPPGLAITLWKALI